METKVLLTTLLVNKLELEGSGQTIDLLFSLNLDITMLISMLDSTLLFMV